jgi:hypothetical protein
MDETRRRTQDDERLGPPGLSAAQARKAAARDTARRRLEIAAWQATPRGQAVLTRRQQSLEARVRR